jgi:hypothetical protein
VWGAEERVACALFEGELMGIFDGKKDPVLVPDPTQMPDGGMPNLKPKEILAADPVIVSKPKEAKCPTCGRDKPNQE